MTRVLVKGTVTKILGGTSTVDAGPDGLYVCDLRARLFRKDGLRLAVGDRVAIVPTDDSDEGARRGVIEEMEPRRSALRRVRDFKRDQVVCANVDRIFIVVAAGDPPYKRPFIDRLLVGVARDELQATIVVNKMDLTDDDYRALIDDDLDVYGRLGHESLLVSAETGEGIEALRAALRDRISAVVGPSGVGKSTLLNAVCPGLALRTGEVSEVDGRGRHTTTSAELVRLPDSGGFVIDTPGLRAFGLWDLQPGELLIGFKDIDDAAVGCRFTNCGHREEPGCAVRQAVEEGEVDAERYASFLKLRDEVEAEAALRQATRRR